MDQLQIRLFGGIHVSHGAGQPELRLMPGVQLLLGFLVLHRSRTFTREVLAGQFWGDVPDRQARYCLNTALWRLRKVLEPPGIPAGTYLLKIPGSEIGFNEESNHWLDVAEFEVRARIIAQRPGGVKGEDIDAVAAALGHYTGDLLEGFYDDWVLRERIRLQDLHCNILEWLMAHYRQTGQLNRGIDCGLKILACDPLREEIHCQVIRLYLDHGQRSRALRQYQQCCDLLSSELGIPPMEETRALYGRITGDGELPSGRSDDPINHDKAEGLIQNALRRIGQAQRLIGQANQLLRSASDRTR